MYLVEVVLLCQGNCLSPPQVSLVDLGCNASKLCQLMLLKCRGQSYLVVVVVGGDAVPESTVILLLDEQLVDSLVDCSKVGFLHRQEVVLDQGEVICPPHNGNHTSMVHPSLQNLQNRRSQGQSPLSEIRS